MPTYVCSDIHGVKEKYEKMLEIIEFSSSDTLYILGDVIDRGANGIEILQDIVQRNNVTLLLGNHEIMMIEALKGLGWKEDFLNWRQNEIVIDWYNNNGRSTAEGFMCISAKKQNEIMNYLETSYVVIPNLKVGEKVFYLVHGRPDVTDDLEQTVVFERNRNYHYYDKYVWSRYEYRETFFKSGRKVILGHTPTWMFQDNEPYRSYHYAEVYNIDCSCATDTVNSRLCCMRLEDMKEFYT